MVCLWPDFRKIERIEETILCLVVCHDLDKHRPAREFTALDALKKVSLMRFAILPNECFRFLIRQIIDALLGSQMEFNPNSLIPPVDEAERVTPKPCILRNVRGMPRSLITIVT